MHIAALHGHYLKGTHENPAGGKLNILIKLKWNSITWFKLGSNRYFLVPIEISNFIFHFHFLEVFTKSFFCFLFFVFLIFWGLQKVKMNKTKCLINTIASYNGYRWKMAYWHWLTHSHTPNLEMLLHINKTKRLIDATTSNNGYRRNNTQWSSRVHFMKSCIFIGKVQ